MSKHFFILIRQFRFNNIMIDKFFVINEQCISRSSFIQCTVSLRAEIRLETRLNILSRQPFRDISYKSTDFPLLTLDDVLSFLRA